MRKDYMAVSASDGTSEETAFVEDYWTRIWEGGEGDGAWNREIRRREEFRIMEPLLGSLPQGARILDGGCGLGRWTVCLASMGYKVVGLDISSPTITALGHQFPDIDFQTGDLRSTSFEENSFDAYFSWGAFEHFEGGLGECFREAARIVKPGGLLFVSVPFHNGRLRRRDRRPLREVDRGCSDSGYETPMRFYQWRLTRQELEREFEIHGFQAMLMRPIHKDVGVHRLIVTDWGIPADSKLHALLRLCLTPVLTRGFVAHMIIGAGRKRG